jgi:hypothetical protein
MDGSIKIVRQLGHVFEPYHMMFQGGERKTEALITVFLQRWEKY